MSSLNKQVSGGHYKEYAIQPVEFIAANNLDFFQGNVIKYILRHRDKNGAEDLKKAIHYIELMLELYYNHESKEESFNPESLPRAEGNTQNQR
jgi:hypothetical protein